MAHCLSVGRTTCRDRTTPNQTTAAAHLRRDTEGRGQEEGREGPPECDGKRDISAVGNF
jgi:hypothetical protein